jgi:hypothetical protein
MTVGCKAVNAGTTYRTIRVAADDLPEAIAVQCGGHLRTVAVAMGERSSDRNGTTVM